MTQERPRKQISDLRRYSIARTNFSNILNDQETPLTGGRLQRALFAVEQAADTLTTRTLKTNEIEIVALAQKAEAEAKRRGQPATAKLMELAQTDIADRYAIRGGEYPLLEVRTQLPQQDGDPTIYTSVYQAKGRKVFGQPITLYLPRVNL